MNVQHCCWSLCVWCLCLHVTCKLFVGNVTWNWALMLGGFFFLCRCSRDLVVRSCSVRLTMNFRERESSKFCTTVRREINFPLALTPVTVYSLYLPLNLGCLLGFTLGMTCLCLVVFCFLLKTAKQDPESVRGTKAVKGLWKDDKNK